MEIYNQPGMSDIEASPDKIRQQAMAAKELCEKLLAHIKTIEKEVDTSACFWETDSSRLLYDYYKEDMLDYIDLKKKLYLRIEQLNKIAAIYERAEEDSRDTASALPDTILE